MFHSQQSLLAEFAMSQRHDPAQADKPAAGAQGHTSDTGQLAGPIGRDPFARNEISSQNDPKYEDTQIAHDAHETDHEGGTRMECFLDLYFEFVSCRSQMHRDVSDRLGKQEFCSQEKHEHEAKKFHRRLDDAPGEERGETSEGNETVNYLHRSRAQSNHHRPIESAAGAFIHNGKIDGPNRY